MTFLAQNQNRSPMLAQLLAEDPQYAAGQAALKAGSSTAPVQSPLEGLARALQGAAGGYFTGQARQRAQGRQNDYSETLAKALQAAQGWRNPDVNANPGSVAQEAYDATAANVGGMEPRRYLGPGETVQGGTNAMAEVLAGNADTAPLGLGLQFQEMQNQQELAQKRALADAEFARKYSPAAVEGEKALADARRDPNANIPSAVREYEFAKSQGFPGSFTDFELSRRKASATQVNVGGEEKEEGKAVGKYYGEAYADMQKGALAARSDNSRMERLDQLLDQVNTGKFAGSTIELKAAAKHLGIDLEALGIRDDVAPAQAAAALSNQMALELRNPSGGAGMPGAMSDQDREFLKSMSPGLEQTREGRKLMIATKRKLNERSMEVARMARKYRQKNGQLDEGFFDELQTYSEAHPLFEGMSAPGQTPGTPTDLKSLSDDELLRQLGVK